MTYNLWQRDFTMARAAILAVLIAFALAGQAVPQAFGEPVVKGDTGGLQIIPAVIQMLGVECQDDDPGVTL